MHRNWYKLDNWLDAIKHLAYMGILSVLAIAFFFYIYLPFSTNHGETITVPDVMGIHYDQLDEYLTDRDLRYEITEDSSYSTEQEPLTVLRQFPLPNSKVKENRKIYLTLNSASAPKIRMPDLLEGSLQNAQMVLKTYDLRLGKIEYIPDLFFNTVLAQKMDGRDVLAGEMISKGSIIDVQLGDGAGNIDLENPMLLGLDEESALTAIVGSGLKIGKVKYDTENLAVITEINDEGEEEKTEFEVSPGQVFRQWPDPSKPMRLQQVVDVWIYKPDSINLNPSILDQ